MRRSFLIALALMGAPVLATAQTSEQSFEERMRKLEQRQEQLERELERKDERIEELERRLEGEAAAPAAGEPAGVPAPTPVEAPAAEPAPVPPTKAAEIYAEQEEEEYESWGTLDAGKGFKVANTVYGDLNISAYALARYINQLPEDQVFTDHQGRTQIVDTRQDFSLHRAMVHLRGWLLDPRFRYQLTTWTVNSLEDVRLIGNLSYRFADQFTLWAGVNGLPGTRSLQGSHPLWLAHDRVMADEFVRPGFTQGVWANGQILPRLWYNAMIANNLSALGVNAAELTRDLAYAASLWWMPTTGEFGPQGGYGDFEFHEDLATRFGTSYTISPKEDRNSQASASSPDNTQIRIGDSRLLFELDSLGPGLLVEKARYQLAAVDAAFKYRGFFLMGEGYYRRLDDFTSNLPVPMGSLEDTGFYVQTAFFPIPKLVELYVSTSHIFTDDEIDMDGENYAWEYLFGVNWFPFKSRYHRLNFQFIDVTRSPVDSLFGFYRAGLTGQSITAAASVMF